MKTIEKKKIFFRWLKTNNLWGHWCKCFYLYPCAEFTCEKWERFVKENYAVKGAEFEDFKEVVINAPFVWNKSTYPKILNFPTWDEVDEAWRNYLNSKYEQIFYQN